MEQEITAPARRRMLGAASKFLPIGLVSVYLIGFGVFAYVAKGAGPYSGELSVTLWVQSWRTPWLDNVMTAVSAPGFRLVGLPLVVLITAFLYLKGHRIELLVMCGAALVTSGVDQIIGRLVARPRPADDLVQILRELDGFSFPSGHVTYYVVFLGVLTYVSARDMPPGPVRLILHSAVLIALLAVGFSRIYLGAHWIGDVLAGYAVGAAVVAGSLAVLRRWRRSELARVPGVVNGEPGVHRPDP